MASRVGTDYRAIEQEVAMFGIEDAMARIEEFAYSDEIEERQSRLRRERTSDTYDDGPERAFRFSSLGLAIGAQVNVQHKESEWRPFADKLTKQIGKTFEITPPQQYVVEYLSDDEMEPILQRRIARARLRSSGKESGIIRGVKDEINRWVQQEFRYEQETETMIFDEDPDLGRLCIERSLDPDNPKWFEIDYDALESDSVLNARATLLHAWRDAIYEARGKLGTPNATSVSVMLKDAHDIHESNRNKIVDMLSDKYGLDTRTITTDWQPEFTIFTTVSEKHMGWHKNVRVPAMPLIVPLKSPKAYEVKR